MKHYMHGKRNLPIVFRLNGALKKTGAFVVLSPKNLIVFAADLAAAVFQAGVQGKLRV